RAAVRVFGLCTRLLPRAQYEAFAHEIAADFRGIAIQAHERRGALGVALVLMHSTIDVLVRAASDRWSASSETSEARLPLGEHMQLLVTSSGWPRARSRNGLASLSLPC